MERYPAYCGHVKDPKSSIFMDEDTRAYLDVGHKENYYFDLNSANVVDYFLHLLRHPDRYIKLITWFTIITAAIGVIGWTLKDLIRGG